MYPGAWAPDVSYIMGLADPRAHASVYVVFCVFDRVVEAKFAHFYRFGIRSCLAAMS